MSITTTWSTVDTEAGAFSAIVDEEGIVLASGWTSRLEDLLKLTPEVAASGAPTPRNVPDLGAVTRAVVDYHRGDPQAVDDIPVRQSSGEFIEHTWDVLRKVPAGAPVSYTELATLSGRPRAARAAATACARNAVALFVPCHRVVRGDGSLGGFRWGVPVKQWLLTHESR